MSAVKELTSQEEFHSLLRNPNLIVIHFYAEWATECQPMNEVLETLATEAELKVSSSSMIVYMLSFIQSVCIGSDVCQNCR